MTKNASIVIGDRLAAFIESQVAEGRYGSASDVRLLEEQETRLAALRAALIEGEKSGASTPFDVEAFIARKRAENARP
jgi:antitoxin ParD1/3/4